MNTVEISHALRGLRCQSVGVFAADRIPLILEYPAGIVVNTDIHTKPGKHWVALYIDKKGHGTFFDSYGIAPYIDHHIKRIRRNCLRYEWNVKRLQSLTTNVCGQYCVLFLYNMCSGKTLKEFCDTFSNSYSHNDRLVLKLYKIIVQKNKKINSCHVIRFSNDSSKGNGLQSCSAIK